MGERAQPGDYFFPSVGARRIVAGSVDRPAARGQRAGHRAHYRGGGTSLPELTTSVLAGFRGKRAIAVGNVVGSNLFNLLAVLGVTAVVAPGGVPVSESILWFDFPVMIATAVAGLPFSSPDR